MEELGMSLDKITYKHVIYDIIGRIFLIRNGVVLFYNGNVEQQRVFNLTRRIKDETEALMSYTEAYQLFRAAQAAAKIEGDMAEVGVYKGGSARIICEAKGSKPIHLFDTFEGFPQQDLGADRCDNRFKQTSVAEVLRYIGDASNIVVKKGYIPNTFKGLENECFAFALLDLDLYIPTIKSLEFFYPRLPQGGYLMIHDYNNPESNWGCKRAVDEFMSGKLESIMEIADEYGTVMFRKI